MTDIERLEIGGCTIGITGPEAFVRELGIELTRLGFRDIHTDITPEKISREDTDILITFIGPGQSAESVISSGPTLYSFDFVKGAGVIVLLSEENGANLPHRNLRKWAAEYMAGYCAFWQVEGCEWLSEALPEITGGMTDTVALKTAAHLCARIAANIADGRMVKQFPRFYLCRNLY